MVTDIELEAVGLLGTMCENKAAKDVLDIVFDMLAALDSDKFYQMTDDEKKQFLRPFVNNIAVLNLEQGAELPQKREVVLFASLLPEPMGTALDGHFKKNGWELQAWDNGKVQGYQVFFGDGVQVDNSYEYGFPYLYDKDELLAFAEGFYDRHILGEPIYVAVFNHIGSGNELLSTYEKELAARVSKECSVSLVNGDTLCFHGATGQEISDLMEATGADYNYSYESPEAAWNTYVPLEDQIQTASSIAEQSKAAGAPQKEQGQVR